MTSEIHSRKGYKSENEIARPSTGRPLEIITKKGSQVDKKHIPQDGKKKQQ